MHPPEQPEADLTDAASKDASPAKDARLDNLQLDDAQLDDAPLEDAPLAAAPVGRAYVKLIVAALLIVGMLVGWMLVSDLLKLRDLAEYRRHLAEVARNEPLLVYGGAFLLYVLMTGLSLPVGPPLKILYGAVFGFLPAAVLVSFAATLGALVAFASSRYLARDWMQKRFARQLRRVNSALRKEGPLYLASLRLFPVAPFFVINLVMGVTPMRAWTFAWVSWLAMLPITCAYVFAGASINLDRIAASGLTGLLTWPFVTALTLLAIAPLGLRLAWWWFKHRFAHPADS